MTLLAVMRPREKMAESEQAAKAMGFDTICASPLEIQTNDGPAFDRFLEELGEGKADLVILTSSTGVASVMELASKRMPPERFVKLMNGARVIAIGPLTAKAMDQYRLDVAGMPEVYSSEGLVDMLGSSSGRRIFILRSDHGEGLLLSGLRGAGNNVTEVVVYNLVAVDSDRLDRLVSETVAGKVDVFAFTSALSAQTFIEAAEKKAPRDEVVKLLNSRLVAAMGTPTRDKLAAMGINVHVVPSSATFQGMLEAIRAAQ